MSTRTFCEKGSSKTNLLKAGSGGTVGGKMKILALNTPYKPKFSRSSRSPAVTKGGTIYYPLWLAYATGVLEKEGHEVKLIDAPADGLSKEDVYRIVEKYQPGMVVIYTSTPSIYNDI